MDIAATFDHEPFRHSAEKYKCLCNKMHCKQGCRIILIVSVIAIILNIISLALDWSANELWGDIAHSFVIIVFIAVVVCFFFALKKENRMMLLPYLAWLICSILFGLFVFIIAVWTLIEPRNETGRYLSSIVPHNNTEDETAEEMFEEDKSVVRAMSTFGIIVSLLIISICIWFAFVVYKYFIYLRDMKRARNPKTEVHNEMNTLKKKLQQ